MATGTSQNFSIASGGWSAYTATVNDDPTTSSSGVIVNGLRQWQWDISGPSFYSTGTSHMIYFVPGTTTTNGEWYQTGSTPVLGTRSGTNGTTITLGTVAVFDETAAFNGAVPSTGGGTGTSAGVGFTASFYDVTSSSFSYEVTHTSAFTSPQTYELHSTTLTPTFISDLVVAGATGSSNSRSHTWGTPDVIQIRDAYGTIGAELTLSHSASGAKRVHCNFW